MLADIRAKLADLRRTERSRRSGVTQLTPTCDRLRGRALHAFERLQQSSADDVDTLQQALEDLLEVKSAGVSGLTPTRDRLRQQIRVSLRRMYCRDDSGG